MKTRDHLLVAAAVAVLIVGSSVGVASAAEPVTWSVSPANADGPDGRSWIELAADPGEIVSENLALRNLGAETATFTVSAADGYFTETGRFNMLQSGETSVDAGTWITVEETVTVAAGATVVVPFTVVVPENATPGDHAAGIAASVTSVGTTTDGTQIGVESRVGFRVITQVAGELAPSLAITEVTADYTPSWSLFSPGEVTVSYVATNEGNTQLTFGDDVSGVTTDRGDLFPGESRSVTVAPSKVWPLGLISVDVVLAASVPTDDGIEVPPTSHTATVWAPPWLHLATLAVLAIIVTAFVAARRRNAASIERRIEEARAEGRREQSAMR